MYRGSGRTTEPKIRSRRCDDESAKCSASSRRALPSVSQHACCRSQYLQLSTPSRLALDGPDLWTRNCQLPEGRSMTLTIVPATPHTSVSAGSREATRFRDCSERRRRASSSRRAGTHGRCVQPPQIAIGPVNIAMATATQAIFTLPAGSKNPHFRGNGRPRLTVRIKRLRL